MGAVKQSEIDHGVDEVSEALDDLARRYESSMPIDTLLEAIEIAEERSSVTPSVNHLKALLEFHGGAAALPTSRPF